MNPNIFLSGDATGNQVVYLTFHVGGRQGGYCSEANWIGAFKTSRDISLRLNTTYQV